MDERKIIKFGNSSFVLTLPNEWIKKNKLNKGDPLNIVINKDYLILSKKIEKIEKSIKINLNDKPLKLFNRELISYYLKNYKFIEIIGKNVLDKIEQIKIFKEKLSSVEIVEMNNDKIVLKDLTSANELKIKYIISDIVEMEKTIFNELVKENTDYKKSRFISQLDSNINKMTFLGYKAINYNLDSIKNPEEIKDSIHYWRIISSLENIGDIIKRIARYLQNETNEHNHFITLVCNEVKNYFEFTANLLDEKINLDNNLSIYLDKKQSLLREIEKLREQLEDNLNLFLVISQLINIKILY